VEALDPFQIGFVCPIFHDAPSNARGAANQFFHVLSADQGSKWTPQWQLDRFAR
jgi:hypothetical protein